MQRGDLEIHESSPDTVMGDVRWAKGDGHAGGSSGNRMHRLRGSALWRETTAGSPPLNSLRLPPDALRLFGSQGHLRGDLDAHALVVVEHLFGGHPPGFEHDFRHL